MTFLMTDDAEIDHHATVSDQKMTGTIVSRGTKGGVNIRLLLCHFPISYQKVIFTC